MALFSCQFYSCLANSLEDYPNVPDKVPSIFGCNFNIVHVLTTLASLDNWVQVLTHEAQKSRYRSVETLCKSFIGKSSARKVECEHLY